MKNIYKFTGELLESFYIRELLKNRYLILTSLIISVILYIIVYPGIYYSDSYGRLGLAEYIRTYTWNSGAECKLWLTSIPSFFIAFCKIFGSSSLYTLIQSFLFFLVSFLFIKKLSIKNTLIQYILFIINPLFIAVSVWLEPSIGCIIGLVMFILISNSDKHKSKLDQVIECFLICLASMFLFGYRANSITVLPVILFFISIKKTHINTKIFPIVALSIGLILNSLLPLLYNIKPCKLHPISAGITWELLEAIQNTDNKSYYNYLDDLITRGATVDAIKKMKKEPRSVNGFLWKSEISPFNDHYSVDDINIALFNKYINFAVKEPRAFLHTKLSFMKNSLGITKPLSFFEYDYNRWSRMSNYHFNDCKLRQDFVNFINKFMSGNNLFNYPFVWYILTLFFMFLPSKHKKIHLEIFALSVFYYLAFLLNNQAFEVRYFLPSLYLMVIMDTSILVEAFYKLKFKFKLKSGKH